MKSPRRSRRLFAVAIVAAALTAPQSIPTAFAAGPGSSGSSGETGGSDGSPGSANVRSGERNLDPRAPRSLRTPVEADFAEMMKTVDPLEMLLAGHLLRRAGFGPSPTDMKKVLKKGRDKWIDRQLSPKLKSSAKGMPKPPKKPSEDYDWLRRWYVRMAKSKAQLREKMTLIWHEHFATSNEKVEVGLWMNDQENLLRAYALGNFRDFLVAVTKDQAMLVWLDNNYNDGTAPEPPNENYAREFLQLFSVGTHLLNLDGTPVLDGSGAVIPAYLEDDVREVSRALTGWYADSPPKSDNSQFAESLHDSGDKTIMGVVLPGRSGPDGALEVEDVVDLILAERQTTIAAFISKMLVQKLATESPSPLYVQDVATVFRDTGGNLTETVRTILKHPEFTSAAVIHSMPKEPIEQYLGAVRALYGVTRGDALIDWTYEAGQLVYYPPSVFSFYPPGERGDLLNTAMVFERDEMADEFVRGNTDTFFSPKKLIKKGKLKTPDETVDYLSNLLLAGPLQTEIRDEVIAYMEGEVTEDKVTGAVWLILCSPDYQMN